MIMVVVDRLTKYNHFIALVHPFLVSIMAIAYLNHVYKLHGNPSTIVSDKRPNLYQQILVRTVQTSKSINPFVFLISSIDRWTN